MYFHSARCPRRRETDLVFEPLHQEPAGSHESRFFFVRRDEVLVRETDGLSARPLLANELEPFAGPPRQRVLLGRHGSTLYWVAELPSEVADIPAGHRLEGLRPLHGHLNDVEWNIGGRATQLWDWYRDHQFCGRCGNPMEMSAGERSMRCPVDGLLSYPRLSPAVIVLVERDDGRALLGRSGRWDTPMYSTLAGFVEAGETLEDTVHREIREEAGVEVDEVRYFASQPWPFPNSLMLGFTARWASGDIQIDDDEIVDAQWFAHDDLPMIPPKVSIARRLIDDWIDRVTPRV